MPRNLPNGKAKSLRQSLCKTTRTQEVFLRASWLCSVHLEIAELQFIKLESRKAGKPSEKIQSEARTPCICAASVKRNLQQLVGGTGTTKMWLRHFKLLKADRNCIRAAGAMSSVLLPMMLLPEAANQGCEGKTIPAMLTRSLSSSVGLSWSRINRKLLPRAGSWDIKPT